MATWVSVLLVATCALYLQIRERELETRLATAIQVPAAEVLDAVHTLAAAVGLGEKTGIVDEGVLRFQATSLEFALVSDLDKVSRDPQRFIWHALLQRGVLHFKPGGSFADGQWRIEWLGTKKFESKIAIKNRSMELSELVIHRGELLAVCDVTGLVYRVDLTRDQVYQRWALADGDGDSTKPFKAEWATVKDGTLLIGSMGREWYREDGSVESHNNQWVKSIDRNGKLLSRDWRPVYEAFRLITNTTHPGYLWHEAVEWDPQRRQWIVLPRKASSQPYSEEADETRCTNILLLASEDFSSIVVRRLGPLEPEWGFSALRKVPGSSSTYLALKTLEAGGRTGTRVLLFDLEGPEAEPRLLLDPPIQEVGGEGPQEMAAKYEGLAFLYGVP